MCRATRTCAPAPVGGGGRGGGGADSGWGADSGGGGGGGGGADNGGGGGGGGSGDPNDTNDETSECATQTATFCLGTCSTVSGSLSCSATWTATSTGCDLTGGTTTTTQSCSSIPCQTAVITTIGGGPASSITICSDCEAAPTDPGPISPLYTLPPGIDPVIDAPSSDFDTAAAFAAMQSIDFQQLSFFPGGMLPVATTETFAEPAGPLTIPVIANDNLTIAPPSAAVATTTTAEPPAVVSPGVPLESFQLPAGNHPCLPSSDCPQSNCNSDQTPICTPNVTCLCGSSSLNLGPLGVKVRRAYSTALKRFGRS